MNGLPRFLDWLDEAAAGFIRLAYLAAGITAVALYFGAGHLPRVIEDPLNGALPWALAAAVETHTYITARRVRAAWQEKNWTALKVNLGILAGLLAFSAWNQLNYLANGSRIVSLPSSEATIRGFSAVDLAIFDEDARVPDDLYRAVRPMLAVSDGRLILMSTPFGKRGHFYETWENGGDVWERVKIPAYDCPRISAAFLAEERVSLGELWFQSEYLCEFADTVNAVFTHDMVMGAFSNEVKPLFGVSDAFASGASSNLTTGALPPLFGE